MKNHNGLTLVPSPEFMRSMQTELAKIISINVERVKLSGDPRHAEVIEAAQELQNVIDVVSRRGDLFKPYDRHRITRELGNLIQFLGASLPSPSDPAVSL